MFLLGVDIGTSACKLVLFDEAGQACCANTQPYPVYYPAPGYAEQDAEDWWQAVCRGIPQLLLAAGACASDIAAVGVDGQSWSAVPIDNEGRTLCNTPIWMDGRAALICAEYEQRLGREAIFRVGANPFSPAYTLPKLLYFMRERPDMIARAQKLLQSNSFIVYRLTGVISQDLSQSYGWQNFDQTTLRYDEALTNALGIDRRFLIDPVPSHTVVGGITPAAAQACGLRPGTPVVAGGLDAACGALGVGVIRPGETQEQGGQAGGMSICVARPLSHPRLILGHHVTPDSWLLQGGTAAGGASLRWFAAQLGGGLPEGPLCRGDAEVFRMLSDEAAAAPLGANGVLFLPYLNGERSPIWDPEARGMFFGLHMGATHADLARATMEGVAFSLAHNLETAQEAGATVSALYATGGSARSHIWTQIKADVTGKQMIVPTGDVATPAGAAMLAGVGVGMYRDHAEAVSKFTRIGRVQAPDADHHARYAPYLRLYKALYPANAALMHALADIDQRSVMEENV